MTVIKAPIPADQLTIVPANDSVWSVTCFVVRLGHRSRGLVGARQVFEDAGFQEVSHPTARRVVMRIDFDHEGV